MNLKGIIASQTQGQDPDYFSGDSFLSNGTDNELNTGIVFNQNTRCRIWQKMLELAPDVNQFIGSYDNSLGDVYFGITTADVFRFDYGAASFTGGLPDANNHIYKISDGQLFIDDVVILGTQGTSIGTPTNTFSIFDYNGFSSPRPTKTEFYAMEIVHNGDTHLWTVDAANEEIVYTINGVAQTTPTIQGTVLTSQWVDANAPAFPPEGFTAVSSFSDLTTELGNGTQNIAFNTGTFTFTRNIANEIPNNSQWVGDSSVILDMNGYKLEETSHTGFSAKNLTFREGTKILFQTSSNLSFTDCSVLEMKENGIVVYICSDMTFDNCLFDNMGTENRDPTIYNDYTTLGAGIRATTSTNMEVKNCTFTHIRSQGGIYMYQNAYNFDIHNNHFQYTCFRGVHMYSGSTAYSGYIRNNLFEDMGNGDGVCAEGNIVCDGGAVNAYGYGCNAIYSQTSADMSGLYIDDNQIYRCYENFIETRCNRIKGNYMEGSGIDIENHRSNPAYDSHEGIYSSEAHIIDNTIVDAGGGLSVGYDSEHQAAIRWDAGYGSIEDYVISGNTIRTTTGFEVNKPCIKLNVGSGTVNGLDILNNTMSGYSSAYNIIAGTKIDDVYSGNTLDGVPVD